MTKLATLRPLSQSHSLPAVAMPKSGEEEERENGTQAVSEAVAFVSRRCDAIDGHCCAHAGRRPITWQMTSQLVCGRCQFVLQPPANADDVADDVTKVFEKARI